MKCGRMMIDPETRDAVETISIGRVEKAGGMLANVESDKVGNVKDPVKEAMMKEAKKASHSNHRWGDCPWSPH